MQSDIKTDGYKVFGRTAVALHWIMALIIIGLLLLGQTLIGDHGASWKATLHASLGFLVLALIIFRIYWRFKHPTPPAESGTPKWQAFAARCSHGLLYFLMIVIPLSGWLAFTENVKRNFGVASASFFWFAKIPLLPNFGINFHFIYKMAG